MLLEQAINGLILGSMYALIALGYTLIFGVLDKFNFAHPEVFMLGGYVGLVTIGASGSMWLAIPAVIVVAMVLGLAIELISFRRFKTADAQITAALSSLAVGLLIVDLSHKIWGTEPRSIGIPSEIYTAGIELAGMQFNYLKLVVLGVTIALMIGLNLVLERTRMGRNIRAVADAATPASLLGVNVTRVTQQTFMLASALAGLAGLMIAFRTSIADSEIGLTFGLKAFAIMAIGGLGDLRGTVIAGLLVGLVEAMAFEFGFGRLSDLFVWLFMIVVLLVKPSGILGRGHVRENRP